MYFQCIFIGIEQLIAIHCHLKTGFRYKKGGPGVSHVQLSFSSRRVNISFYASPNSYLLHTARN